MNHFRCGRADVGYVVIALIEKVNELVDKVNTLSGESETFPAGACPHCYGTIGLGKCPECGKVFGD
jgi:hypothetical protein